MSIIRDNERSWAIELISEINRLTQNNDWKIKKAGGERTISNSRNSMFPDVILFGDNSRSFILQGWELKMPDVPIEDEVFIKDAQRKADALGLNSCVIWNFTYVVLYVKNGNNFEKAMTWDKTSCIRTRDDVSKYENKWKALLEEVIIFINGYLTNNVITPSSIRKVVSSSIITELVKRNKSITAGYLKSNAIRKPSIDATIQIWWLNIKNEYAKDEKDEYDAYAKSLIIHWTIRILFAHIIKIKQNTAFLIDDFDENTTPSELNAVFDSITDKCDFYNVFVSMPCDEFIPKETWNDFVEFSKFLKNNSVANFDQESFQNILEETISINRRELNGQYTTPEILAEILLKLSVTKWDGTILDCCCGTGTIPQKAINIKKEKTNIQQAIQTVWASDKYAYPLQVANISMSSPESINMANKIFQKNALSVKIGDIIYITNPRTGEKEPHQIHGFDSIVSNLPFITFENIDDEDRSIISSCPEFYNMNGKADLYSYIAAHLSTILNDEGRVGLITSNSWLATDDGGFLKVLENYYNILQIHLSGAGRWFHNAEVVTTLIILEKKSSDTPSQPCFVLWNKTLDELEENENFKTQLINGAILSSNLYPEIYNLTKYSSEEMSDLKSMKVSYNAFFYEIKWLPRIKDKLIPLNTIFEVFRGSRRGWDKLFYPEAGQHNIENIYLRPVLINAKNVKKFDVKADNVAFCCKESMDELIDNGRTGAIDWIRKFETQRNGTGKLLPEVLAKNNMQWYELKENEIAEFFTMMNPDKRFFYGKFNNPSFINQRLIGLNVRDSFNHIDKELLHALLNSVVCYFYIEASGFGRGQGVLDINKNNIENSFMLNPSLLSEDNKRLIIEKFNTIKAREITDIESELCLQDRVDFETVVFESFGISEYYETIIHSLKSMIRARLSAKK